MINSEEEEEQLLLKLIPLELKMFEQKEINLSKTIQIGRNCSKTSPTTENGVFDSKVLSRQHAEIYLTSGKVFSK